MRIVCVADTHGQLVDLPDGDVLVHAGDITRSGTLDQLDASLAYLESRPHRHKVIIAGNHDFCFQKYPDEARRAARIRGLTYLQDSGTTIDGVRLWGSPWQPWFYDWAFNLPRGIALAERWAMVPKETDVLITHGPAYGHGDQVPRERVGCRDLLKRCLEIGQDREFSSASPYPLLHLFGHIHEDGGVSTEGGVTFVNCTVAEGERQATVIDFYDGVIHIQGQRVAA